MLCGETADSCLCAFLGIDPYQSTLYILVLYIEAEVHTLFTVSRPQAEATVNLR